MEGFVYQWINKSNGKWYIGSHKGTPDDGYTAGGININRAFKKYGIENFKRNILWCEDYRGMEDYYLKKLDAANDPMSYNIKNDAIGGWKHVHKEGLHRQNKSGENNPNYGRRMTYSRDGVFLGTREDIAKLYGRTIHYARYLFRKKILKREGYVT